MADNASFTFPTETVTLPSQGKLYELTNPLSSGAVEMKYMTAREEDILTNQNYIKQGVVIEKLLKSLIITKIDYDELIIGDKNAVMVAARILSYGSKYEFNYNGVEQEVDLSSLEAKPLHPDFAKATSNNFTYTLPHSKNTIRFKLLTHGDENRIDQEIKGLQKINKNLSSEVTVRLSHSIVAVDGDRDRKVIRDFVRNMPIKDSKDLRKNIVLNTPDIIMKFDFTLSSGEVVEGLNIPMTIDFFWPDFGV
jgi:hypothetical protein